jgi:hypothetical protein
MNILLACIAASLGWQTGYERLPEGGMEYIIQLDAPAIDALQRGQPIGSYLPSDIGQVRSFRVVMGTGRPKREAPWPAAPPKAVEKPAAPKIVEKPAPAKAVEKPAPQQPETPSKPWLPLILTLLTLFASLGANVFLGWIAWGFRQRCQSPS